jgi:murein DD-endopeptidase MepM/ murein hydrolase activator NlpD
MNSRSGGIITFLAFLGVLGGFAVVLFNNAEPAQPLRVIVPTQAEPTSAVNNWEVVLQSGFGSNSTPLPTIPPPEDIFVAPTIPPMDSSGSTPVSAADLNEGGISFDAPVSARATPTPLSPTNTPIPAETDEEIREIVLTSEPLEPQPPSLRVPFNRDPLGRDHYVFARPVDPLNNNRALYSYSYGADGFSSESPSRIHHGIDISNRVGTTIRAAGSGVVRFASSRETPFFQNTASYGNVVYVEHDFGGPNGEKLFTLYAHLQQTLVFTGDIVKTGDPIGLNGATGQTTGAHLHFEVRMVDKDAGEARYGDTYNPILWMAPYVGHGTIAGRLLDSRGNLVNDASITIRDYETGLNIRTTSTYEMTGSVNDVNMDPLWQENFATGDIAAGRYQVIATYDDGSRTSGLLEVFEGRTSFIELTPDENNIVAATVTPPSTINTDG